MAGTEIKADVWINEYITPWDIYSHGVERILASRVTEYQEMHVVQSGAYGKGLVLDGKWQSCTGDEFLYHEPLVHPALLFHGAPRRVLILGGGEGATSREVFRWKSIEKVTMIDIDSAVVEACREHLPEMHQGSFDDPRHEVRIEDAAKFLDTTETRWDVVISDLSDPIEEGPSFQFFTKEYFAKVQGVLEKDGVFVVQAGPVSPLGMGMHARLVQTMKAVYPSTASYASFVPTYAAPWSFILGRQREFDPRPDPSTMDRDLAEKTHGGCRMFDGTTLLGMLQLPLHLRKAIAEETEVYTLAHPPKFFGKGAAQESMR